MIWNSYKQSLSKLSNKEKGDSFERLTKQYLTYDPKYATKLKHVWLLSEVPSSIHKKLNLPDQDQGIDLICETNEGEYWAIQSKYHEDESTSQTWKSLSTFTGLAFGVCKNISFGLVCTTAERFTKTLKNQDNIGFCTGEVWRSLDESFFDSFLKHRKPKKLKAFKPYTHQKRAIRNAHEHYVAEKESRGKMIMPCGTGKSLTAFWIADKLDAKRIIVAVPSLALIRQTLQVWLRESYAKGWDVNWITVCSDESVGKITRDDLAVLKQDLGVPAITDPKVIAQFLRKRHNGKVVVFTTYQSGKAIAEASKLAKRNFDLGIMDEAHKTVGSKDKTFSHLLFDKNIKITKRVFMTATERRYAGNKDEVISMDDMNVYGDTFEFLSFKEALEETPPILSDYKIVTMMISKDEVADLVKKRAFVKPTRGKWDKDIEADMLASLIALRKAIRRFRIKHAITFHGSIAKAKAFTDNQPIFTDLFPQYWKTDNFHVSGKMPTSLRARHMQEFEKSKRAIMTNARCLTEGVDVPDIDCVLFADPKKSTIDIVQAVGRALRLSKGKKFGYVIVPVIIEDDKQFAESDAFQSILMTLRALASNDERIIDYFRARSQKKRTYTNFQIEVDERIAEKINVKDFTRELELQVWNKLAKLSWRTFEEAREFVHGLNLKTQKEWYDYASGLRKDLTTKPSDIPRNVGQVYVGKGWSGFGDWLGTGRVADHLKSYRSYEDAKLFVHQLNLKSNRDWRGYTKGNLKDKPKLPSDIPVGASKTYKRLGGWKGWGDFLGTGNVYKDDYKWMNYKDAKAYARKRKFKNQKEYYASAKKEDWPKGLPKSPGGVYKKEWKGWGDFLGTGNVSKGDFLDYNKCKNFVISLNLESSDAWEKYKNNELVEKVGIFPKNIPKAPSLYYKNNGWEGWGVFLGTGRIATQNREYKTFTEARKFARSLNLKNRSEWRLYCYNKINKRKKLPNDVPIKPEKVYKNSGWAGYTDWLGAIKRIKPRSIKYFSFTKAKSYMQKFNLKSANHFHKMKYDLPWEIPRAPHKAYEKQGWIDYADFLGYNKRERADLMSFHDSRLFAQSLNLKSSSEWKKYVKGDIPHLPQKPNGCPTKPKEIHSYKKYWKGWPDFLGYKERKFYSFDIARDEVRALNFKTQKDYKIFAREPHNYMFPVKPERTYKEKGWKGWPDFLGYEPKRKKK